MNKTSKIEAASVDLTFVKEDGSDWDRWTVKQTEIKTDLSYPKEYSEINWEFGPIKLGGYVETSTFECCLTPVLNGLYVGMISGNLKEGIHINVDLFTMKGSMFIYLRHANEAWVELDQKIIFGGHYQVDRRISQW
ncbi:hypothetical protein BJX96DRAFT_157043 [Aspergillus floccosus]